MLPIPSPGPPTPTPTPSPTPEVGKPLNISTRLNVGTADNVLIGGFIVSGSTPKQVILRAIGPSLASVGLTGLLQDPTLELHDSAGALIVSNDDWRNIQEAEMKEATRLPPSDDREAAIVRTLDPGSLYGHFTRAKMTPPGPPWSRFTISIQRSRTQSWPTSAPVDWCKRMLGVMIAGFIISEGGQNAQVLIRAIGPSLRAGVWGDGRPGRPGLGVTRCKRSSHLE